MIESVLQEIGLTQNETKVYLAMLSLGESKTTAILRKASINSGKIYEILDSLEKKGLVSKIDKSGVLHFTPADPRRVLIYLDEKKKHLDEERKNYESILPTLLKDVSGISSDAKIEVYAGLAGMRTAWSKEFDYPKTELIRVMGLTASTDYPREIWEYFTNIHRKKRDLAGYRVQKLLSASAKPERSLHEKNSEIRYIPEGSLVSIGIVGNLTIIGIFTQEPITITIESERVAAHFKQNFSLVWKNAAKK